MAELQLFRLDYTFNRTELEVYTYSIFQKIITGLWKLYKKGDTYELQPITYNILVQIISRFGQKTF